MRSGQMYEIISLCKGMSCVFNGSEDTHDELEAEIERRGLKDKIEIVESCCKGDCEIGPNANLLNRGVKLNHLTVEKVAKLIEEIESEL